jgi:hypothetical protein
VVTYHELGYWLADANSTAWCARHLLRIVRAAAEMCERELATRQQRTNDANQRRRSDRVTEYFHD